MIRFVHSSGEEGFYPDLTKHAEKCLNVIKPTSIILRKSEPILKRDMLGPNECKEIDKDINDWMFEMQIREKDLEEGKTTLLNPLPSPDIREFKEESLKVFNYYLNFVTYIIYLLHILFIF